MIYPILSVARSLRKSIIGLRLGASSGLLPSASKEVISPTSGSANSPPALRKRSNCSAIIANSLSATPTWKRSSDLDSTTTEAIRTATEPQCA